MEENLLTLVHVVGRNNHETCSSWYGDRNLLVSLLNDWDTVCYLTHVGDNVNYKTMK